MTILAEITLLGWPAWQAATAGVILVAAFWLQGMVGFGSGLFAIPIMIWCGIALPDAIAVCYAGAVLQTTWNCYHYRSHIPWRDMPIMTISRMISLPVGVALLGFLASIGQENIKLTVGGVLLGVLVLQNTLRPKPRDHVHSGWTVFAGLTSGLLAGVVGMGGPPLVLWLMAHRWPNEKYRSFLWAQFLVLMPIALCILIYKFGTSILTGMATGFICTPFIILAATLGARTGTKLSIERLRLIAYVLLYILAISSIVGAFL